MTQSGKRGSDSEKTENDTSDSTAQEKTISPVRRRIRKIIRCGLLLFGLLIACLGYDYYIFKTAQPNITVNYVLKQDHEVLKIPEEDRGWPLYREAMSNLFPKDIQCPESILHNTGNMNSLEEENPEWVKVKKYLVEHRQDIDLFLEAARKPHKGFISKFSDPELKKYETISLNPESNTPRQDPADRYLGNVLPYQQGIYKTALTLLKWELRRAEQEEDHQRIYGIIEGWLNLELQLRDTGEPGYEAGGFAMHPVSYHAIRNTLRLLTNKPHVFTDQQLNELQQQYSEMRITARWRELSFKQQQVHFDDILQRFYAGEEPDATFLCGSAFNDSLLVLRENFSGLKGVKSELFHWMLSGKNGSPSSSPHLEPWMRELISYSLYRSSGTKAEIREKYLELLELYQKDMQKPWGDSVDSEYVQAVQNIMETPRLAYQYWVVLKLMGIEGNSSIRLNFRIQHAHCVYNSFCLDTVRTAVALERFRRRFQRWPETLEELVPDYLPAVPQDPFDGQPLKYLVQEGKPVLYSVGINGTDERGEIIQLPVNADGLFSSEKNWLRKDHMGDYRLFPYQFAEWK